MTTQHFIDITNMVSGIFTAIGTVGAVCVALWLSYKNSTPKLKVYATVGILFPDQLKSLWLTCVNVGNQPIICTGFALVPNKAKPLRIMPTKQASGLSSDQLPKLLQYSDRISQYFDLSFINDNNLPLSKHRWLAKIQLKFFWKIVAITNIMEFSGELSDDLKKELLFIRFQK